MRPIHLTALLAALATPVALAVSTVPNAAITLTFPAGTLASPTLTPFSLTHHDTVPLTFVGASAGRITGVTAASIQKSDAGWAPAQFLVPATPYFLRITSGEAEGFTLLIRPSGVTHTATEVFVDNQGVDLTTLGILTGLSTGDTFIIFPADTLATFFADLVSSGTLLTGANVASADNVQMFLNGVWRTYYHNGTEWRIGFGSGNNEVIRPDTAVLFYRRGASDVTMVLTGTVPASDLTVSIRDSGTTSMGSLFPVNTTLGALGLQNLPNWVRNTSAGSADKVLLRDGGVWRPYHYAGTPGVDGSWRQGFSSGKDDTPIALGSSFVIVKVGAASTATPTTFGLPYDPFAP